MCGCVGLRTTCWSGFSSSRASRTNSGCQAWHQSSLSVELSHQPSSEPEADLELTLKSMAKLFSVSVFNRQIKIVYIQDMHSAGHFLL